MSKQTPTQMARESAVALIEHVYVPMAQIAAQMIQTTYAGYEQMHAMNNSQAREVRHQLYMVRVARTRKQIAECVTGSRHVLFTMAMREPFCVAGSAGSLAVFLADATRESVDEWRTMLADAMSASQSAPEPQTTDATESAEQIALASGYIAENTYDHAAFCALSGEQQRDMLAGWQAADDEPDDDSDAARYDRLVALGLAPERDENTYADDADHAMRMIEARDERAYYAGARLVAGCEYERDATRTRTSGYTLVRWLSRSFATQSDAMRYAARRVARRGLAECASLTTREYASQPAPQTTDDEPAPRSHAARDAAETRYAEQIAYAYLDTMSADDTARRMRQYHANILHESADALVARCVAHVAQCAWQYATQQSQTTRIGGARLAFMRYAALAHTGEDGWLVVQTNKHLYALARSRGIYRVRWLRRQTTACHSLRQRIARQQIAFAPDYRALLMRNFNERAW